MGKTIGEWETYFNQVSSDFLKEIINALETLQKAEMIYEEFEKTLLFTLISIAKAVKQHRLEIWSQELKEASQ